MSVLHSPSLSKVRQEPGGRADAQAMEGAAHWLALPELLSLLWDSVQDHRLREGALSPSTPTTNHKCTSALLAAFS